MNEAAQIGTDSTERCVISMDSKSLTANKEAVAADRVFKMNERKREAQEGLADYQARERAVSAPHGPRRAGRGAGSHSEEDQKERQYLQSSQVEVTSLGTAGAVTSVRFSRYTSGRASGARPCETY